MPQQKPQSSAADEAAADLARYGAGVDAAQTAGGAAKQTPSTSVPVRTGGMRHALSEAWDEANPIKILSNLVSMAAHPVDAAKGIGDKLVRTASKPLNQFHPGLMVGDLLVGDIVDQAASGDLGGAIGRGIGRSITAAIPGTKGMRSAVASVPKRVAQLGAGAILGQAPKSPTVAAALTERALPSMFGKGPARASAREADIVGSIDKTLQGPGAPGRREMRPLVSGPHIRAEKERILDRGGRSADLNAAEQDLADTARHPRLVRPTTVDDVLSFAKSEGWSPMSRAAHDDLRVQAGRVAPEVATDLERLGGVQDVKNAYNTTAPKMLIDPSGLTMRGRLAAGTVNRVLSPVIQSVYRAGEAIESPALATAIRSAVLSSLLNR